VKNKKIKIKKVKKKERTSQGRASARAGWAPGGSSANIACLV
jgi:hypothetical protein